jgi:hypothetical protein
MKKSHRFQESRHLELCESSHIGSSFSVQKHDIHTVVVQGRSNFHRDLSNFKQFRPSRFVAFHCRLHRAAVVKHQTKIVIRQGQQIRHENRIDPTNTFNKAEQEMEQTIFLLPLLQHMKNFV